MNLAHLYEQDSENVQEITTSIEVPIEDEDLIVEEGKLFAHINGSLFALTGVTATTSGLVAKIIVNGPRADWRNCSICGCRLVDYRCVSFTCPGYRHEYWQVSAYSEW